MNFIAWHKNRNEAQQSCFKGTISHTILTSLHAQNCNERFGKHFEHYSIIVHAFEKIVSAVFIYRIELSGVQFTIRHIMQNIMFIKIEKPQRMAFRSTLIP